MASNHTQHYALNQWARNDQILMDDFNADNAKLDAALQAEANARTALETALGSGGNNCRIATGSYVGTGTYGPSNRNSLQFDFTPALVLVLDGAAPNTNSHMLRGAAKAWGYNGTIDLEWSAHGVAWSCPRSGGDADRQLNRQGATYYYLALGY